MIAIRLLQSALALPTPKEIMQSRRWQFCLSVIAWLTVLVSFNISHAEGAAESTARSEPKAGQLLLKNGAGFDRAIHLNSEVDIQISGLIAKVKLIQHFENASSEWREGVYLFPLPENAAVNFMKLRVGERQIVATIKERNEAKRIYQQAKSAGKKAGLTEQERPNLFTQSIANIGPGETISVEIHYLQQVDYRDGVFNLHFPMTLTPRFIAGIPRANTDESELVATGTGWATATHLVPDASRISPPQLARTDTAQQQNTAAIKVSLDAGLPLEKIDSLYHTVRTLRDGTRYHIQPDSSAVPMNRDFQLQWQPVASDSPRAALFSESVAGERYAMAMLLPPSIDQPSARLPREVIFVIDTSGSMQGSSIMQARRSLLIALARLHSADRFNVVEFDNHYSTLFPQPVMANPRNIQRARDFVRSLQADGGTEMAPALAEALRHAPSQGYVKQVVFITDGAVGNEEHLFKLINTRLGEARLFPIGIGSAPNRFFMRKAAQFGRGTFTYVGDINDVESKLSILFEKLENPLLSQLAVDWPSADDIWPRRLPDLYRGEPLMLVAKLKNGSGKLTFSGHSGDKPWRRVLTLSSLTQHAGVSTLWARAKIDALLDRKISGGDKDDIRDEVLPIALRHQLITPYTSLVAVEQTPSRPRTEVLDKQSVANAVPAGQQALNYPATATTGPLQQLLGALGVAALLVLRRRRRLLEQHA